MLGIWVWQLLQIYVAHVQDLRGTPPPQIGVRRRHQATLLICCALTAEHDCMLASASGRRCILFTVGHNSSGDWTLCKRQKTDRVFLGLLRRGAAPPEGRGGRGPLSTGGSPAAAASLSALPCQYSPHLCSGSKTSMASVNCTDINKAPFRLQR